MATPLESVWGELRALGQLPPEESAAEGVGRSLRELYLRQAKLPLAGLLEGAQTAGRTLGDFASQATRGLMGQPKPTPAGPTKVGGPGPDHPIWKKITPQAESSTAAAAPEAPKPQPTSPMRALRDASGRVTFTNDPKLGGQEIALEAATASMRPQGKRAGGVSYPTAVDASGSPTMIDDPAVQRARQKEAEGLAHAALVRRLQDEADPSRKVQEDLKVAAQLADALAPSPEAMKARVEATFQAAVEAAKAAGQQVDAAALRRLIEQDMANQAAKQRTEALQAMLMMRSFPGQALSGYGQLERYTNQPY